MSRLVPARTTSSKNPKLWSPKWNDKLKAFTFFIRFKQDDAEKILALSNPGSIVVDTPVELANTFKHVWLRVDGENLSDDKVHEIMLSTRNFGAFEKNGIWAIRTFEQELSALKASLGIDVNPSYVVRRLPTQRVHVAIWGIFGP